MSCYWNTAWVQMYLFNMSLLNTCLYPVQVCLPSTCVWSYMPVTYVWHVIRGLCSSFLFNTVTPHLPFLESMGRLLVIHQNLRGLFCLCGWKVWSCLNPVPFTHTTGPHILSRSESVKVLEPVLQVFSIVLLSPWKRGRGGRKMLYKGPSCPL